MKNGIKIDMNYTNHKKHTYEFIRQSFEKENYILLSTEYINAHQYLNFICPNGHKHKIKWSDWKQNVRCGYCVKNQYNEIKKSFEKENYILLTEKYKNRNTHLDFICPNGHKHKITWNNWKSGCRCGKCDISSVSKPEKEIVNYIKNNYNGNIKLNDRTLIKNPKTNKYLELDILLPELRKAIEYNGSYWHSDKYQQWKDNYKQQWCNKNSVDLLIIEHDKWIKNKNWNIINNFINNISDRND